mmetsp:Transcript_9211/g.19128  ORF Transcript_9211/g.19128 Transcript_9211/m.19128 type:complete len:261 (+) Transcript_9211:91-873(+)
MESISFQSIDRSTQLLSNQQLGVFSVHELVRRNLQVEWGRSLADSSRNIVVRSVAGAEPSVVFSGIRYGDASQVGANGQDHNPFVGEDSVFVGLWVTQTAHWDGADCIYFLGPSLSDENGFSTPLDGERLTVFDCAEIEIGRCQSGSRGGNGKGGHKFHHQQSSRRGIGKSDSGKHKIGKGTALGFRNLVDSVGVEAIVHTSVIVQGFCTRGDRNRGPTTTARLPCRRSAGEGSESRKRGSRRQFVCSCGTLEGSECLGR